MRKKILILLSLCLLIFLFFQAVFVYNVYFKRSEAARTVSFLISRGEGVNQISRNLYENKLIKSKFFFEIYVWFKDKEASFLAGEYLLSPGLNIKETVEILTSGQTVSRERTIKIIEGWKINDINEYLIKEGVIKDNSFIRLAKSKKLSWPFPLQNHPVADYMPVEADLEGFLFPDTYRIYKDASAEDIIIRLLDNFNRKLTEKMRVDIAAQGRTIYETVILASLVEKEVKKEEDMKIVAGIFLNRLRSGQPLESCATLAYILGVNKAQYTVEDTLVDSPYNTYKNKGLPPGPIANPGLTALMASVYPVETDYNYFLNRPDNGETVFAKTYNEHLQNKNRYLK